MDFETDHDIDLRARRCRKTREFRTDRAYDEKHRRKPMLDSVDREARIKAHRKRIQKQLKKIKNRN